MKILLGITLSEVGEDVWMSKYFSIGAIPIPRYLHVPVNLEHDTIP